MYDFDTVIDRSDSTSIKWNEQYDFHGKANGLIPFWIADTDFPVANEIIEAFKKRCEHPVFGYADPLPRTFEAIQGWWERRHGWKPDTAWMFMTCGVVTGINFALCAFVPQGEKVLTFTPVYDPFFAAVKNSGHTLVTCPLDYVSNYYTINFEKFEEELKNGVKAVIFCNPHNPVGRVWTYEELEKVCALCKKYDVYLLSDEVHCDYAFTRPYTPMGVFEQIHDLLVVFTSPAKSFNLAGLVAACIIVPNKDLRDRLRYEFDSRWMFGPTDFAYTAMDAAYGHADVWMDEVSAYIKANAEYAADYIHEHMPLVGVTKHEGTFLMWLDFSALGISSSEMTSMLAKEYGIAVGDGSHYDPFSEGFIRFNIGCARSILLKGLEALKAMYDDHQSES